MSPQYIPVPSPTTTMIISGVIALGLLLLLSAFLGVLGKRKWESFDEYLVGRRDIGPLITGAALSASYISGWAFCGSTGIVYTLGFSGMWFAGIWSLVGIIPCIWLAAMKTREFSVSSKQPPCLKRSGNDSIPKCSRPSSPFPCFSSCLCIPSAS